ncbi:MAG: amidohydrolase family protein [Thermomicrobiales bacterium]
MAIDLSGIRVVDQHCHQWRKAAPPYTPETYQPLFTEGSDGRIGQGAATSIYYRWTIRELARVLACDPNEEAVLAVRADIGHEGLATRLMGEANIEGAVIDYWYTGRGSDLYTVEEMTEQLGGAWTKSALRLESLLESLIVDSADAGEVEDRFRARLNREGLLAEGVVSLKSIIAYRTGLQVSKVEKDEAYEYFSKAKSITSVQGHVRIDDKAFLDYFLRLALKWASEERFPVQFHTGFGDPDVYLITGNPLVLRDVLQDQTYRDVPFVFLHASYPYVRDLSYLASVYPNVYLDFGLAIPFVASEYEAILRQALALAPTSRVLYSSDGFAVPEHHWFAAVHGRRALASVLTGFVDRGMIGEEDQFEIAEQILRGNAYRLYGLEPPI